MHNEDENALTLKSCLISFLKNISLLIIIVPQLSCSGSVSTYRNPASPTNLEIMARLTQEIAKGLIQDSHLSSDDTCCVLFVHAEEFQFLEHAFMDAISQTCSAVGFSPNGPQVSATFEVQPTRALVQYDNMFRDGLFGEKKVERLITIEFSSKVLKNRLSEVAFVGLKKEAFRDTVTVHTVEYLSSPGVKATFATLPSETFFDRIIEPLVIVGATGVLIYLFFTLRS